MRLLFESSGAHIWDPELNGPKSLFVQASTMLLLLDLGGISRDHFFLNLAPNAAVGNVKIEARLQI